MPDQPDTAATHDERIVEICYVILRSGLAFGALLAAVRWGLPRLGMVLPWSVQEALTQAGGLAATGWALVSLVRFERGLRRAAAERGAGA